LKPVERVAASFCAAAGELFQQIAVDGIVNDADGEPPATAAVTAEGLSPVAEVLDSRPAPTAVWPIISCSISRNR